ncbi:PLDc N-terminal domain-containing protein [Microbacterium sp. G2-8]|uniref:PLDc N-terminal domain-containing protein n=1 Tax=Microbacterium sp. G2-8 TaxID=2842454 RepID=UPI001C891B88|nr:PLDc N-terminal domain-containing protein [Microbacterium sp. G2-8]
MTDTNPLVPTAIDLIWSGAAVVVLGVTILALVSLVRTRFDRGLAFLGWFVLVVALPLLGPFLWFSSDRRKAATAARR